MIAVGKENPELNKVGINTTYDHMTSYTIKDYNYISSLIFLNICVQALNVMFFSFSLIPLSWT